MFFSDQQLSNTEDIRTIKEANKALSASFTSFVHNKVTLNPIDNIERSIFETFQILPLVKGIFKFQFSQKKLRF